MAGLKIKPTPAEIEATRAALDGMLLRIAVEKQVVRTPNDAVLRDLLADTDMLASGDIQYFSQTLAAGWNNPTYSGENPDDRVWGIYGVMSACQSGETPKTPATTAIRFWDEVGRTAVKDIWPVQPLMAQYNGTEPIILLAESPIIYEPSRGFNIDQYSRAATTDQVVYLGRVCEPKGKVVKGEK